MKFPHLILIVPAVLLLLFFSSPITVLAEPVEIKGANGRVIAFDGIREAVPKGLWLRLKAGGEEMAVPWDKLDLASLKADHPKIHAAWQAAQQGKSTMLELGSYERASVNLSIADAIEAVSKHDDAKAHPAAESLNVLPYLYKTGGDDHPLPFRFHAPEVEFRSGDTKIPLVIWLHGAGSGGTDNFKSVNVNLARKILDESSPFKGRCCLLFPQYHDDYNWWTYTSDKRGFKRGVPGRQILDLVDEICEKIPAVDPDRIYLMGMSQGGFGIPYLVTAYPNRFAAQVLVAGMTWTVPWTKKNAIPSWLFYSKDDKIMNQNGTDYGAEMTQTLEGVLDKDQIKITIYEDAGHGGTLQRALEDPGVFSWLAQQKNEETPKRDNAVASKHFD